MIHGRVAPGFEPLQDAFAEVLREDDAGAALAVVRDGSTVVDLWGGVDPLSGRQWGTDSVTLAFSAAKGMVALLMALSIQQGELDPVAPVARYWPEFAAAGKGTITVADVLTHVAGLPSLPVSATAEFLDPLGLAARLAAVPPEYPPRSARTYHILSYGVIAGEILRRVTGRDAGTLLQERVAGRLGGALWLGLPPEQDGRYLPGLMEPVVVPTPPLPGASAACWAAHRANAQITPLFERVDGALGSEPFNSPAFRRALVLGGGLVADARSLARAYGACVARVDGVRLLTDATVELASRDWQDGIAEPVCTPGAATTTRWGLGFEISHPLAPMLGSGSFGHTGMGGRLAFAHLPSRTGFAFLGQRMSFPAPGQDPRWHRLMAALRSVTPS